MGELQQVRKATRHSVFALFVLTIGACGGDSGDGGAREATTSPEQTAANGESGSATTAATGFPKTPVCRKPAEPTPDQTEGPFYKPGSPMRKSLLAAGVSGRRLVVRGRVLSTDCQPVGRARVEVWQADGKGDYDNDGFRLRGYQLTDSKGRYRVETVVPAAYEGRTRHIHVKVRAPGGATLTTQLYFPGEARNRSDSIFVRETLVRLRRGSSPWRASFDFIVERG